MLMAESPSSRTSRTYMGGRLWFCWRANLTRNISYGGSALRLVLKSKIDIVLLVVEDADWTQPTRIKSLKLQSPRLQATISLHGRLPHSPLALRNLLQKWSPVFRRQLLHSGIYPSVILIEPGCVALDPDLPESSRRSHRV